MRASPRKVLELDDELSEEGSSADKAIFAHNSQDEDDLGATPNTAPRRCTDKFWLVMYLLYSCVVIRIGFYVFPRGQPMALLKLSDWKNDHCGIGENKNMSLLFFCLRDTDPFRRKLNIFYPICVSECPTREFQGLFQCPRNIHNEPFTTTTVTTTRLTSTSLQTSPPPPNIPPPSPYRNYWKPISEAERGGLYDQPDWYPQSPYSNPYQTPYDRPYRDNPYQDFWPDDPYGRHGFHAYSPREKDQSPLADYPPEPTARRSMETGALARLDLFFGRSPILPRIHTKCDLFNSVPQQKHRD